MSTVTGVTGVFSKAKDFFMSKPKEARMLAVAGAGNLVLGGGGFVSKILDFAGIACLFAPVLMPFMAAAYLIRGAWQLVKGVFCLLKGDFKGFLGNLAAGALNIFCALPFGRVKNAWNLIKTRSRTFVPLGEKELTKLGLKKAGEGVTKEELTGLIAKNKERITGRVAGEQKIITSAKESLTKAETSIVQAAGKKEFNHSVISSHSKILAENVQKAKDAIQIAAQDVAKKEAAEKLLKDAVEKQGAFRKLLAEKRAIQRDVRCADLRKSDWSAVLDQAKSAEALAGQDLVKAAKTYNDSLHSLGLDYKSFFKNLFRVAYRGNGRKAIDLTNSFLKSDRVKSFTEKAKQTFDTAKQAATSRATQVTNA